MTAQNMGKKILTDAGYEVVAVSNGAAAVKKIAEHKPDIIILDIYMPGYSGLEVCDKVRSSHDTLKTPVLLTVGKMEPYRAEDANRVRADGVIIKPFEASDLLAVIKKLEERVVPRTMAMAQETVLLERPPEFTEFAPPMPEDHSERHGERGGNTIQGTVDVPDNMATTAAFSDMLGMEPAHSVEPLPVPRNPSAMEFEVPPEPPAEAPEPSAPVVESPSASWGQSQTAEPQAVLAASAPAPVEEPPISAQHGFGVADTQPIFVDHEPESKPSAAAEEIPIHAQPAKAATVEFAEILSRVEEHAFIDPGLAIDAVSFDEPVPAKEEVEVAPTVEPAAVVEAPPFEAVAAKPVEEVGFEQARHEAPPTEDDFDARVAKAMTIYDEPVEERVEPEPPLRAEARPSPSEVPTIHEPTVTFDNETPPSFEYSPPVSEPRSHEVVASASAVETESATAAERARPAEANHEEPTQPERPTESPWYIRESAIHTGPMLVTTEATQVIPVYLDSPPEPVRRPEPVAVVEPERKEPVVVAEPLRPEPAPAVEPVTAVPEETVQAVEQKVAARIESATPAVTAAAAALPGADTQVITNVVERILERLKPHMIEEISKELKSKK